MNLLVRHRPGSVEELRDLAGRMAAAHAATDLAEIRALTAERARLTAGLAAEASALAEEAGQAATEVVRTEVLGTLQAAVADPAVLELVATGRLEKSQVYSGFGFPLDLAVPPAAPRPAEPEVAAEPGDAPLRAALEAAEAEHQRAAGACADAEAAETLARERLDRASQEVADLRAELRAAEAAELDARAAATAAAEELHDARTMEQRAEAELAAAKAALTAGRTGP